MQSERDKTTHLLYVI